VFWSVALTRFALFAALVDIGPASAANQSDLSLGEQVMSRLDLTRLVSACWDVLLGCSCQFGHARCSHAVSRKLSSSAT
jgi:hypothetical protein